MIHSRRSFIGAGLAAAAMAGSAPGAEKPAKKKCPLEMGMPGYMFKNYKLDEIISMLKRMDVRHLALKPRHLPMYGEPAELRAALDKLKSAKIELYGAGVIYMKNETDVENAFKASKAAGLKLFTASLNPQLLSPAEKFAKQLDIKMAIHNHGPEDKFYPTPLEIHEKIRRLDGRICICHDTGHTIRAGADPTEAHLKTADRTLDFHLKDVDLAENKGHSVELGRGIMDIPKFLRAVLKTGYGGVMGIEYEKHMKDILPGLSESIGYTRGVLAGIA